MNFCAKTEYACLALVELARRHASGSPAPVREIAEAQRIPEKFLVQILHQLKSAGLVISARGALGGYLLARDPEEMTLDEVIEAMEGRPYLRQPGQRHPGERGQGERPTPAMIALSGVWQEIDASVNDLLRSTPLSELARRCADADPMYYI
ncbi:MAG TPA: Rrf2 family transcriptional regulator [Pirellulaceae bacterium]|nr:Rrf2 family transcriptional regulator [Pirellulaceae bacterium]